jgi:hypothetical protein
MNPFVFGKTVSGKNYCERPEQEKLLKSYLQAGQNVLLQGDRRVGKTSLASKVAGSIRGKRVLYADFMFCNEARDVTEQIAKAVLRVASEGGFLQKAMTTLSSLRPTMTLDESTGKPSFSVSIESKLNNTPETIEQALDVLSTIHAKNPLIVIFDEFQDVLRLPDHNRILARMRSRIQFQESLSYIFSGSSRVGMNAIFNDSQSPFYKSTAPLIIEPLTGDAFQKFLAQKFRKTKRKPSADLWKEIATLGLRATGDIQQLCWAIWQTTEAGFYVSTDSIPPALELIFSIESAAYESIASNSSTAQLKVLKGLSAMRSESIYSVAFKESTGLLANGTITKACNLLEKRNIIRKSGKTWLLENPYFGLWLAKR